MASTLYAKKLENGNIRTSYSSNFTNGYETYHSILQFSIWLEWQKDINVVWKENSK